jgi:hypothetical protein
MEFVCLLCLTKHYAMKTYGGVDVSIHVVLTSALVGCEWSASRPGHFVPGGKAPGICLIGGWVGPRARFDDNENIKFLTLKETQTPAPRPSST